MKQMIVAGVACVAAWTGRAVEWTAGADVTVSEDTAVTEAEYAAVNACASVTVAEGVKLSFQTKAPPTVTLKGTGTLVKDTSEPWTLTTVQTEFTGSWDLKYGVTTNNCKQPFGSNVSETPTRSIVVEDGATLVNNYNAFKAGPWWYDLAGTGAPGQGGALVNTANAQSTGTCFGMFRLGQGKDATISLAGYYFSQNYSGTPQGSGSGVYSYFRYDLQGNTLTYTNQVAGAVPCVYMCSGGSILSSGALKMAHVCLCLRGADLNPKTADVQAKVILGDCSTLNFYNDVVALKLPVEVEPGATVAYYHSHQFGKTTCPDAPGRLVDLPRGVHLGEGSTLRVGLYYNGSATFDGTTIANGGIQTYGSTNDAQHISISGPITGSGTIDCFSQDSSYTKYGGYVHLRCPTNTWTGNTRILLSKWTDSTFSHERVCDLPYSNSIPNYAGVQVTGGNIELAVTTNAYGWSDSAISRFIHLAALDAGGAVTVNAGALESKSVTLNVAQEEGRAKGVLSVGGTASNDQQMVLSAPTAKVIQPNVFSGNVAVPLQAGEVLTLTNTVRHTDDFLGTLRVTGGELSVTNSLPFLLGGKYGMHALTLTDVLVQQALNTADDEFTDVTDRAWCIGYANGIAGADGVDTLVIKSGSVVTNKMSIGAEGGGRALVKVESGASLTWLGTRSARVSDANCTAIGNSGKALAACDISGDVTALGPLAVGVEGYAVVRQRAGSWDVKVHPMATAAADATYAWVNMPYKPGGHASVLISGGVSEWSGSILACRNGNSECFFTLSGADTVFKCPADFNHGYSNGKTCININEGATLEGHIATRYTQKELASKTWRPQVWLGFNGGRIRALSNKAVIYGAVWRENPVSERPLLNGLTVYEKGMIVDTADRSASIDNPITGAVGYGVTKIAYVTEKSLGIIPYVTISGGSGEGASAFADTDPETGRVTGIVVTSPGFGYAKDDVVTAKIVTGYDTVKGTNTYDLVTCTLGQHAATGGDFTLEGTTGTLSLGATNSWTGNTVLRGGTLKLTCDEAIPADRIVVLSGGRLDMNGYKLKGDLAYPLKWGVDAAYAATVEGGVVCSDNITFSAASTFDVLNIDQLSKDQKNATLLTLSGTITGTKPKLDASPDPHYVYTWSGNSIKLRHLRGTVISFR